MLDLCFSIYVSIIDVRLTEERKKWTLLFQWRA